METGVPEPKTWAMLIMGFGLMGLLGVRKARKNRLGVFAQG
jgi:PEP-CTERM motif